MRTAILLALTLGAACGGGDDDAPARIDAGDHVEADGAQLGAVVLTYRDQTARLGLAYLGYQRSGETVAGLYLEISNMQEPGCPDAESPVPPQLFTVEGFAGAEPATRTFDDGVRVNFFDFEGRLREEIEPAAATAASVTVTELDLDAGIAHGTIDVTFGADGTAVGTFVATHCDSLDGEE